jgi:hypothetical protein
MRKTKVKENAPWLLFLGGEQDAAWRAKYTKKRDRGKNETCF